MPSKLFTVLERYLAHSKYSINRHNYNNDFSLKDIGETEHNLYCNFSLTRLSNFSNKSEI